jgi:hypothetical protein
MKQKKMQLKTDETKNSVEVNNSVETKTNEINSIETNNFVESKNSIESKNPVESNPIEVNNPVEIKKNNSMNLLYIGLALIVLIIAFTSYFYFFVPVENYEFEVERNQVIFQSNLNPKELIQNFSNQKEFLLVIEVQEQGGVNQEMISSSILLTSIFSFNEKKTILVLKAMDFDSKEIIYCETNKGNILEQETLSKQECINYLNELNLPEINVLFPGASEGKAKVLLEENKFTIKTSSPKSALIASQTLLELLFEENNEALKEINDLASRIYS